MPNANFLPIRRRIHPLPARNHSDRSSRTCSWCSKALRDESRQIGAALPRSDTARPVAALGGAFVAHANPGAAFQQMLIVDGFATFFRVLVIIVGILTVLCSGQYLRREGRGGGRVSRAAAVLRRRPVPHGSANELIMIFIGLEISSIATYILAGYLRDDKRNNESALKYFLLGSFATAFLLYGVAWIYGITGSHEPASRSAACSSAGRAQSMSLVGIAAALMFVGLRVQDLGRAISGLGAGRVSGSARSGHGIHVRRTESRGFRDLHSRLHDRVRADLRAGGSRSSGSARCSR